MSQADLRQRSWRRETTKGTYLISTNPLLLDLDFINMAFSSEEMFWAQPLSRNALAIMLAQSLSFGLYEVTPGVPPPATVSEPSTPRTPSPTTDGPLEEKLRQTGFGRLITDHVTTCYLTDVYIAPEVRSQGLGRWLISCINETIEQHPHLRRVMLITSMPPKFYKRFGFWDIGDETKKGLVCMTRKQFLESQEEEKAAAMTGDL
ncbi:Acetyltransferase (GNAT) domain [Teratosphaeria destructans]|uniref:Acetyltransferase (GNAT) domain n=1 Tax=Teratosphaeria destructans TaxID=418781 RepID=A0A9W7SKE0_9PEZI|nr:Acetyltransferase (GNAT) domain [Teratosphaeria destructans]